MDRAVSTVVGYTVSLAVMSILTTGLILAGGNVVEDQRESTVREELTVIGEKLSSDLSAVDRLGRAGDGGNATIERTLPDTVSDRGYRVELSKTATGDPILTVWTSRPDVEVSVGVALHPNTSVAETTVTGGDTVAVYDGADEEVTLRDA